MICPVFGGEITEEFSLDYLEKLKDHRRFRVFYHKGLICANPTCNRVGIKIIKREVRYRSIVQVHLELVSEDYIPMTIDHIHPKSKGGSNQLDNLQPMCCFCNNKKSNH